MKNLFVLSLGLVVAMTVGGVASADDASKNVKSGPEEGDGLGAFYVTKIAGAEEDGVPVDDNLCYRCKNGPRPQVIVFTRSTDGKVAELISKLDKAVAENEESALRVFVNVLGEDKEDVADQAKKLAQTTKAKNVPFVVPNEFENGPGNYGISPKAAVTITLANNSKVHASRGYTKSDDLNVDALLGDLQKMLN